MQWWISQGVPKSKLVMGLPSYSNDYSALPNHGGGNGTQAGSGPPTAGPCSCPSDGCPGPCHRSVGKVEALWEYFSQIFIYMYTDTSGSPRIRYGTEIESTRSQLRTATKLGISQVGFWTFNLADADMVDAAIEWAQAADGRQD